MSLLHWHPAEQRSWRNAVTKTLVTWWSGRTCLQCLQTLSSDEKLVQHSCHDTTKWRVKSCGNWRLCRCASKYTCRRFERTVCTHLHLKESKKSEGTTYGPTETSEHSVTSQKTRKRRRENHKFRTNFISGLPTIWTPAWLWKSVYQVQECKKGSLNSFKHIGFYIGHDLWNWSKSALHVPALKWPAQTFVTNIGYWKRC